MIDRPTRRELLELEWRMRFERGESLPSPYEQDAPLTEAGDADIQHLLATTAPQRAGWSYDEPSDVEAVVGLLPDAAAPAGIPENIDDRVAGAWLGRVAGNMLGKPVEVGWRRARLHDYLLASGSLDGDGYLTDWVVADEAGARDHALEASWPSTTRGRVRGSVRDDDVDYTVFGLMMLERHGEALTAADVADGWLELLPFGQVFTAERVAYANLSAGRMPPQSAEENNPYAEWIGALIRADAYGLAFPGQPRRAATLALRDGSVSHLANGLYGAMWAASLVSNALVGDDVDTTIAASLAEVPARSRLAEVLRSAIEQRARPQSWDSALDALDRLHGLDRLHHVHVLNNAAIIAVALLWGEGDPRRSVGIAVQGALDTDSTAATVGAVTGALLGSQALPASWRTDLGTGVRSGLFGVGTLSFEELTRRTVALRASLAPAG